MNDWKLILKVVGISAVVLFFIIWGLSRMSGSANPLSVDQKTLTEGARFVKENGETKVTVVSFSDIQCPSCKRFHDETGELMNMPGVKNVMRLFPLPPSIHRYALISAKAVEAARIMGKGWEMVDLLYKEQDNWSAVDKIDEKMVEYAMSLGLDGKVFADKLNSKEVAGNVKVDADLADYLRLPGTPTVFVNGEQVGSDFVLGKVKELLAK